MVKRTGPSQGLKKFLSCQAFVAEHTPFLVRLLKLRNGKFGMALEFYLAFNIDSNRLAIGDCSCYILRNFFTICCVL